MTTVNKEQRLLNILQKAINLSFEIDKQETFEQIIISAQDFILEWTEPLFEEVQIERAGICQRIDWTDRMGYHYWVEGDLLSYETMYHTNPGGRIVLATVFNSKGDPVCLVWQKPARYIVRDKEAGNVIDFCDTETDAEQLVQKYEQQDKDEGNYTPNFYEIVKEG